MALETATDICSVALLCADGQLTEHRSQGRGIHSSHTFIYVQALLQQAGLQVSDLNGVVLSAGPGSYTGLRVGSSAVKGLLYGTNVQLFAVSTLGAIALGKAFMDAAPIHPAAPIGSAEPGQSSAPIHPNTRTLPGSARVYEPTQVWPLDTVLQIDAVLDARREHVYHQPWQLGHGRVKPLGPVQVIPLTEALERWRNGAVLAGTGLERLQSLAEKQHIATFGADGTRLDADYEVISAAHVLRYVSVHPAEAEREEKAFLHQVNTAEFEPDYYAEPS